ncbi:hypothetical protein J4573_33635 [Actinomadura barringtoniae]|uniref:Uncharacterized protein n=1 Tax=Actinomadura barringtoniae TaxID=1427535 RepID=A0A939PNZ6_9ACTN|nr:hypothetical protein [Actinomadura barringtoniae]MBO2452071.1 hypothetical protein [Actinomadura barringtoniae]
MRLVIILVAIALLAVVVILIAYGVRGGKTRSAAPARWETHTESAGGTTAVLVRQVTRMPDGELLAELGRQIVAEIPDADPDWEARYHEAMATARSRIAALEAQ